MTSSSLALVDVLAEILDFRQSQGKRYGLTAVLSLAVAALLCGYKSYSAIAEWGRYYGQPLLEALGFTSDPPPCAASLHTILSGLDKEALEGRLAQWTEDLLQASTAVADDYPEPLSREAISVDGKSLRGSNNFLRAITSGSLPGLALICSMRRSNQLCLAAIAALTLIMDGGLWICELAARLKSLLSSSLMRAAG